MPESIYTNEWKNAANIYEVNIRQYTEEGTFNAFAEHLPRLKEMGVKIIWLMPITLSAKKKGKALSAVIMPAVIMFLSILNLVILTILKIWLSRHMSWI
jgi:hypothetical protein